MNCIRRMQEFDLLQFVSPEMLKDRKDLETLERLESVFSWAGMITLPREPETWRVYLLGLFYSLEEEAFLKATDRLQLLGSHLHSTFETGLVGIAYRNMTGSILIEQDFAEYMAAPKYR